MKRYYLEDILETNEISQLDEEMRNSLKAALQGEQAETNKSKAEEENGRYEDDEVRKIMYDDYVGRNPIEPAKVAYINGDILYETLKEFKPAEECRCNCWIHRIMEKLDYG